MSEPSRSLSQRALSRGSAPEGRPWLLVVVALAVFVLGCLATLAIALAHPPAIIR